MKTYHKALSVIVLLCTAVTAFCQNNTDAKALVKEGVALNDSGKYTEAIEKYREALKLDPGNMKAQYELSYTLSASGKPKDAIPYLEKVAASNTYAEAYDLLGSIYDDEKDYEKAVAYYKLGIVAFPGYERLRFNLGISYLRQKMYPEAEAAGVEALKLDPTHASAHRVYALATQVQGKRGNALLAWCNFLLLEPQSKRSPEALNYVKTILNYGVKRTGEKSITISVNPDEGAANLLMPMAISTALDKKTNLSAVDSIQFELTSLLEISTSIIGDGTPPTIKNYYAGYFEKLAKSGNVPAFARYITLSAYKDENLAWFKEHDKELKDLQQWVAATKREF